MKFMKNTFNNKNKYMINDITNIDFIFFIN